MKSLFLFLIFLPAFSFCAWDRVNNSLEKYGDSAQIIMPIVAFSYSLYEKDYKGSGYFAETFAAAQGLTLIIKQTNEERPGTETGGSFPSGHTMSAFASASFLDRRYDIKGKYYFYAAAALTGISRVAAVKHYIHDVLAGALIGFYSNKLLVPRLKDKNFSLIPCYDEKGVYALASLKF